MAEQKTAQQFVREQYKVVETQAEAMIRTWNDLVATSNAAFFNAFDQGMRYNQELRAQAELNMQNSVNSYRRLYEEGLKNWQQYAQSVSSILTRAN